MIFSKKEFAQYVPRFYEEFDGELSEEEVKKGKQWIKMENLLASFRKPCYGDIKIGTKLYEDDASFYKQASMGAFAMLTTSKETGIQIVGMKVYDPLNSSSLTYPKKFGYKVKTSELAVALKQLFCDSRGNLVHSHNIPPMIDQLKTLEWNIRQISGMRMRGSSLFLIHEGSPNLGAGNAKVARASIKVIDFNHSHYNTNETGPDESYLIGLDNLIKYLSEIYESASML